jgi:hypothetical protein
LVAIAHAFAELFELTKKIEITSQQHFGRIFVKNMGEGALRRAFIGRPKQNCNVGNLTAQGRM